MFGASISLMIHFNYGGCLIYLGDRQLNGSLLAGFMLIVRTAALEVSPEQESRRRRAIRTVSLERPPFSHSNRVRLPRRWSIVYFCLSTTIYN